MSVAQIFLVDQRAGEPDPQGLLNPIVKQLGITFGDGRLTQKSEDFAPDFVLAHFSDSAPVAVALTRKTGFKEQRIVIVGDADFMSTAEMVRHIPWTANFDFTTELFNWLNYGVYPVNTNRPGTSDAINISRDGILMVRIVFFCILPLLLLTFGTFCWSSEKGLYEQLPKNAPKIIDYYFIYW